MLLLVLLLFGIAIVDYWQYRIPNVCIIIGIFVGLVEKYRVEGMQSLPEAILQMLIVFLLFLPFYTIRGIGAGDIKLFMMISVFLSKDDMIQMIFLTFLMAAAISIVKMIRYEEGRDRIRYFFYYLKRLLITHHIEDYEIATQKKKTTVRLSIPTFCSMLCLFFGTM